MHFKKSSLGAQWINFLVFVAFHFHSSIVSFVVKSQPGRKMTICLRRWFNWNLTDLLSVQILYNCLFVNHLYQFIYFFYKLSFYYSNLLFTIQTVCANNLQKYKKLLRCTCILINSKRFVSTALFKIISVVISASRMQ